MACTMLLKNKLQFAVNCPFLLTALKSRGKSGIIDCCSGPVAISHPCVNNAVSDDKSTHAPESKLSDKVVAKPELPPAKHINSFSQWVKILRHVLTKRLAAI